MIDPFLVIPCVRDGRRLSSEQRVSQRRKPLCIMKVYVGGRKRGGRMRGKFGMESVWTRRKRRHADMVGTSEWKKRKEKDL